MDRSLTSSCPLHPIHISSISPISSNLASIVGDGMLRSDAAMIARGSPQAAIGMGRIKQRRLELAVKCHPSDVVGQYVPFYFCPRSVMLYIIYRANDPDLTYRGGQGPIVHLEADLHEAVDWAESVGHRWAFSLSNAGAVYTEFRNRLDQLDEVKWDAVGANDFSGEAKEGKQAEFLVYESSPAAPCAADRCGVELVGNVVLQTLANSSSHPLVEVRRDWYF